MAYIPIWVITLASGRNWRSDKQHQKHDRALKKVTELKNAARKEFRLAKKNNNVGDNIKSLANNFFKLVRKQSYLRKQSTKDSNFKSAKKA